MVSNVSTAMQLTAQTSTARTNSSGSSSDTYRDMMDRISQSSKPAEQTTSGREDYKPFKAEKDTADGEIKGQDVPAEETDVAQEAAYANSYLMFMNLQIIQDTEQFGMDGTAFLTGEGGGAQTEPNAADMNVTDVLAADAGRTTETVIPDTNRTAEIVTPDTNRGVETVIPNTKQTAETVIPDTKQTAKAVISDTNRGAETVMPDTNRVAKAVAPDTNLEAETVAADTAQRTDIVEITNGLQTDEVPEQDLQMKAGQVAEAVAAQKPAEENTKPEKAADETGVKAVETDNAVNGKTVSDAIEAKPAREEKSSGETGRESAEDGAQFAGMLRETLQNARTEENVQIQNTAFTGQAAETNTRAEEIMAQLPDDLADQLAAGQKEVTIQLEPESLGKLVIKASFEDGRAMVSIFCTNEKTLEILSSHARDLGSIMESNMGTPTSIVLDKTEENYLNQQRNDEQAQQEARQEQEEQQRRQNEERRRPQNRDFLAQLRLGLV